MAMSEHENNSVHILLMMGLHVLVNSKYVTSFPFFPRKWSILLVKDFWKESDQAVENGMELYNNVYVTGKILCHVKIF